MSFESLPVELYLEIASHLRLRDLIIFRSVSQRLRSTINANISSIRPAARRELLRLWDRVVKSPYFLPSRQHIIPHLRNFDRHAYLTSLPYAATGQLRLPDEFETWILEWPAKSVIGWIWPGLDQGPYYQPSYNEFHDEPCADVWWQLAGGNPLGPTTAYRHVYPFTVKKTEGSGNEEPFLWLDWRFPGWSDDDDIGFGVPVWMVLPGDQQHWAFGTGHMLIVSGLGPAYDGTVQLFEEGFVDPGDSGRLLLKDKPDDEDFREYPYRGWGNRKTKLWFRGQSWTDWLQKQLEILEEGHDFWDWEAWRFQMIDAEHIPFNEN